MTAPPVFTAQPNGSAPLTHELGYLTSVNASRDGTEQRMQGRVIPTERVTYQVSAYEALAQQLLDAALYSAQGTRFIVPAWLDDTRLTVSAASGATSLVCETTDRYFTAGQYAVLWADEQACEAVVISTVGTATLTVAATTRAWPSGTLVLPGRAGWLAEALRLDVQASELVDLMVTFDLERVLTYGVANESAGATP